MAEALRIPVLVAEAVARRAARRGDAAVRRASPAGDLAPARDPSEADLVRRCVAGEEAAQRLFVERYARLVFSICRRKGLAPDAAEDVAQDVLAAAFRALPRFRGEARLSSWLFTLACRHVVSHLRSPGRRLVASGHPGDAGFPAVEPADRGWEQRFADGERARRARQAVEELDEPARTILLAYYLAEQPVREIARELDLPEGTVKSHLHRARAALRRSLEAP